MLQNRFNLNDEQLKPANTLQGRVLVLAGAGTGKTRVLTSRIYNLLESGVSPHNILAITFTNKAANEMKERIAKINTLGNDVLACTFHSLCARILRAEASYLGYESNFTIYDENDKESFIKNILKNKVPDLVDDNDRKKFIKEFIFAVSKAKTEAYYSDKVKGQIYLDNFDTDIAQEVFKIYQSELKKANAMDFDDLLSNVCKLFKENPKVLEKYQDRYRYIHVDEYQDTNKIQHKIVELLGKKYQNIFLVGDEDQGIYSWRGANISNILSYQKTYPETKVYKLERNYRSNSSILEAANLIIANNTLRNKKALWTDRNDGAKVYLKKYYSDRVEASDVIRKIRQDKQKGIAYKSNAILVRANSITRIFEDQCRANNIPYRIFGGFKFYDRKEIKDVVAYLRLLINIKDDAAFLRIVNYPTRGIGDKAVSELAVVANRCGSSYFEAISKCDASLQMKFAKFVSIFNDLRQYENYKPSVITKKLIEITGIKNLLSLSRKPEEIAAYENIQELINTMIEAESLQENLTLREYLEGISLLSTVDQADEKDSLTIATIHSVKGLEFDNIYIVAVEERVFPLKIDSELEEERRLMYVAVTRAKKEVRISYTTQRMRFGRVEAMEPSLFIKEIEPATIHDKEKNENTFKPEYKSKINTKFKVENINVSSQVAKAVNTNLKFKVGQTVYHSIFGEGKVFDINERNNMLAAIFETGIKKFNLDIASRFLE